MISQAEWTAAMGVPIVRNDNEIISRHVSRHLNAKCAADINKEIVRAVSEGQDIPSLTSALSGGWKIVSSDNCGAYLEQRQVPGIYNILFERSDLYFSFESESCKAQTVRIHEQLETRKFHERSFPILLPMVFDNDNGVQEEEEVRFLKDGKLNVTLKRGGVSCTRIYERIAQPLEPSNEGQGSNVLERISQLFSGNWQDVKNPSGYTSLKIQGDKFIRHHEGVKHTRTFGVPEKRDIVYVDGDTIVQAVFSEQNQVTYQSIYSIENGQMVYTGLADEQRMEDAVRYVHRRVEERCTFQ